MKRRNFIKITSGATLTGSFPASGMIQENSPERKLIHDTESNRQTLLKVKNGSKVFHDWTKRKVINLQSLQGFHPDPDLKRSRFGGDQLQNWGGTGHFRTERKNGRWWLVDPDGHPFLAAGFNSVKVPDGFAEKITGILRETGVTEAGCWSDYEKLRNVPNPIPYSVSMGFIDNFKETQPKKDNHGRGWKRRYPNLTIPIFNPAFESFAEQYAKVKLTETKNDPYCIGYFSDNELPFVFDSLERYLEMPEDDYGHQAATEWLQQQKNKTRAQITHQDRMDFLALVADRYFSICSKYIKKYAPGQLYLGSRLHGYDNSLLKSSTSHPVFEACGKHVDVVSINMYGTIGLSLAELNRFSTWAGKPITITEFYAKGMDTEFENNDGAGSLVPTQQDRGLFYQNFVLTLLQSSGCVGWSWHRYIDPEESNKGLVNHQHEVYKPLQEKVKALNDQKYELASYFQNTGKKVKISDNNGAWLLYRNGVPFNIKGQIGIKNLDRLIDAGGNAVKIYGDYSYDLDYVSSKNIAVLFVPDLKDYVNAAIKNQPQKLAAAEQEILQTIKQHKSNPAILGWSLGDNEEFNWSQAEMKIFWTHLNTLMQKVKAEDPDHPVITSISPEGFPYLQDLSKTLTEVDAIGFNVFSQAQFESVPGVLKSKNWQQPFIITEFNYDNDSDILNAPFDVPYWIEGERGSRLEKSYRDVVVSHPQCLGAFMLT